MNSPADTPAIEIACADDADLSDAAVEALASLLLSIGGQEATAASAATP